MTHTSQHSASPNSLPKESTSAINPKMVLQTLARWWHVVIPLGLVLAGTAAVLVYVGYVPEYEARVILQIRPPQNLVFRSRSDTKSYVDDQVAFLRSDVVLEPVLSKVDVAKVEELAKAKDPLAVLSERVSVRADGNSSFYTVVYRSRDPQNAATIANAISESFLNLRNDREHRKRQHLIKVLERLIDKTDQNLTTLQDRLTKMNQEYFRLGSTLTQGPNGLSAAVPPALVRLKEEIGALISEKELLLAEREGIQKELEEASFEVPPEQLAEAIDSAPEVQRKLMVLEQKREEITMLEQRMENTRLKSRNPESLPLYRELVRTVDKLRSQTEKLEKEVDEARRSVRDRVLKQQEQQIALFKKNVLKQHLRKIEDLDRRLLQKEKRYKEELAQAQQVGGEVLTQRDILLLEITQAKEERSNYTAQLKALEIKGEVESVEQIREATVPRLPAGSGPWKKMVAAGGAVFFIPFGIALLWEIRVRRISDPSVLEDHTQIPIIGEVAALPVRQVGRNGHRRGVGIWMFEESIDSLRTNLMVDENLRNARVFAITSAMSQEGKTSVAAQLAVSIARATGKRTVIVDGDMRSPDLHNIFDVDGEAAGLAEVLSDECSINDAVCATQTDNLDVLPAGQLCCNPHSLVGNGHFKGFLNELKKEYDYVVVDTPPLLAASESVMMAKHADASLLCAMRDSSRLDQVRKAYYRLAQASARPVGVVLNGIPVRHYAYRYGDYAYTKANGG